MIRLNTDPLAYLRGREGLPVWQARRLLGESGPQDGDRRDAMLRERLDAQLDDGSWQGELRFGSPALPTAQVLKELHALGLPATDRAIQRGAGWLLARAQSDHNPGMFFLQDDLVAEQAAIVDSRRQGKGGRFRARKAGEISRVRENIPTAPDPCGPRIMWPTALVLEVLIALGYETHPRLQAALEMLRFGGWCECGYQHGDSGWRERAPLGAREIERFEQGCRMEFRYGGLSGLKDLACMDGHALPRVAQQEAPDGTRYTLRLPEHQQPCELVTVLGLSQVKNPLLQRLASAHLWRFAARQHPPQGGFGGEGQRHVTPYFYMDLFSRYDHPAARIALLRMLPWAVANQNANGSWGQGKLQEAATLAVARLLVALRGDLPRLYPLVELMTQNQPGAV